MVMVVLRCVENLSILPALQRAVRAERICLMVSDVRLASVDKVVTIRPSSEAIKSRVIKTFRRAAF